MNEAYYLILIIPREQMTPAAPVHWSLVKVDRGQDWISLSLPSHMTSTKASPALLIPNCEPWVAVASVSTKEVSTSNSTIETGKNVMFVESGLKYLCLYDLVVMTWTLTKFITKLVPTEYFCIDIIPPKVTQGLICLIETVVHSCSICIWAIISTYVLNIASW